MTRKEFLKITGLLGIGLPLQPIMATCETKNVEPTCFTGSVIKHIVQNWDNEPFIRSAYLADVAPSYISNRLSRSIDEKVYFAGEAYCRGNDWGGVHNASRSARDAINEFG